MTMCIVNTARVPIFQVLSKEILQTHAPISYTRTKHVLECVLNALTHTQTSDMQHTPPPANISDTFFFSSFFTRYPYLFIFFKYSFFIHPSSFHFSREKKINHFFCIEQAYYVFFSLLDTASAAHQNAKAIAFRDRNHFKKKSTYTHGHSHTRCFGSIEEQKVG